VTKLPQTIGAIVAFSVASSAVVPAQDKPAAKEIVPVRVQVVISRYQGDKRLGNMPFTLSVNANEMAGAAPRTASLRMGVQVPVSTSPQPEGKTVSYQYKDVGTNIDCSAATTDDGRFRVGLSIEDSSVIPDTADAGATAPKGWPSFRTFRSNTSLLLKDGQTTQFTAATDKVTGDIVKVDVTLTAVK
jgi:Bacterial type II and III secretion system protein